MQFSFLLPFYILLSLSSLSLSFHFNNVFDRRSVLQLFSCSGIPQTTPHSKPEYSLLDCGKGKRLEQFGPITITRSCPAAIWPCGLSSQEWGQAKVHFDTSQVSPGKDGKKNAQRGQWSGLEHIPADWHVSFETPGILFGLAASENGQVNIDLQPNVIGRYYTLIRRKKHQILFCNSSRW
jgi:hypothetical protein